MNAGADVTICAGNSTSLNTSVQFATSCSHSIVLYDDYGDGWNGCTANVLVDGNVVLSNIAITTYSAGPLTFNFNASV